jgi:hypothetical protein
MPRRPGTHLGGRSLFSRLTATSGALVSNVATSLAPVSRRLRGLCILVRFWLTTRGWLGKASDPNKWSSVTGTSL